MEHRRFKAWAGAAAIGILTACGPALAQPGVPKDPTEPLVQELARVVEVGRSRGPMEETMVVGLRSLRDPRLVPMFAALSDSGRWETRVHGVLGLSELEDSEQMSVLAVSQITDPQVRTVVVSEAIKQGLVDEAGLREMLAISGLEPGLRLAMMVKLRRLGAEVTADEVDAITAELAKGQVGMRIYGRLVAANLRGQDGADVWSELDGVASDAAREAILSVVLEQIRDDELTSVTGFVDRAWEWSQGRTATELAAINAMLSQSIERGGEAWAKKWAASSDSLAQRMLLAAVLVEFAPSAPVSMFEPAATDSDPYVRRMGQFGAAVAGGGPFGAELEAALAGEHRLSTGAVLATLYEIEPSRRSASIEIALRRVFERQNRNAAPQYAFELARFLAREDVAKVRMLIEEAIRLEDARMVEVLLTSIMEVDPEPMWEPGKAPTMPNRRTEALAALVMARSTGGAELTDAEVAQLSRIAQGREMLPPAMRVQAAWLALCAAGQEREALARVLAPAPAKPSPTLAD